MDTVAPQRELEILRPPKIYLDTNHLVNIVKVRRGQRLSAGQSTSAYARLDAALCAGLCGIIYSPSAVLEWVGGQATQQTAQELADVIDSAALVYLYEMDRWIWTSELLQECVRVDVSAQIPKLMVLPVVRPGTTYRCSLATLANHVPGFLEPAVVREESLPETVIYEGARLVVERGHHFRSTCPEIYQERINGYSDALKSDMDRAPVGLPVGPDHMRSWAKRYLKIDLILLTYNPRMDVDAVLQSVDFERCPAVSLFFRAREQRIRAKHDPHSSEGDDWSILGVVPYADVVVVDRGFRDSILRADRRLESKVKANAEEAAATLKLP